MWNWFKRDPRRPLQKRLAAKLEEARDALRAGDVRRNAALVAEADTISNELARLEEAAPSRGADAH